MVVQGVPGARAAAEVEGHIFHQTDSHWQQLATLIEWMDKCVIVLFDACMLFPARSALA